ncbi:hypothetical protein FOZ61_008497 [Perkinsus olseni]|uniref:GATOR2 complex protein MIO zinc-ribbon like domain-containing protein n=1 Tax=Perkinsus olseni TaxID=32597 RepID=A0A7J6L4Q1_PEROL|nr:hypothetical protein FOZ61_008497 [Perkinsus olseni]
MAEPTTQSSATSIRTTTGVDSSSSDSAAPDDDSIEGIIRRRSMARWGLGKNLYVPLSSANEGAESVGLDVSKHMLESLVQWRSNIGRDRPLGMNEEQKDGLVSLLTSLISLHRSLAARLRASSASIDAQFFCCDSPDSARDSQPLTVLAPEGITALLLGGDEPYMEPRSPIATVSYFDSSQRSQALESIGYGPYPSTTAAEGGGDVEDSNEGAPVNTSAASSTTIEELWDKVLHDTLYLDIVGATNACNSLMVHPNADDYQVALSNRIGLVLTAVTSVTLEGVTCVQGRSGSISISEFSLNTTSVEPGAPQINSEYLKIALTSCEAATAALENIASRARGYLYRIGDILLAAQVLTHVVKAGVAGASNSADTHAISEQFKMDLDASLSRTEKIVDGAAGGGKTPSPSILYRLAMALRYLWVGRVHELLESSLQSALSTGLLDSLLVCGGGDSHAAVFADIIKKYTEATHGDIQSVALIFCHVPLLASSAHTRSLSDGIVNQYFSMLNRWRLWSLRSELEQYRQLNSPTGYAPAQQIVCCYYCGGNLTGQPSRGQQGMSSLIMDNTRDPFTWRCPYARCHKPVPNCALCLMPITIVNQGARKRNAAHRLPLNEWVTWCSTCHHGGHLKHVTEWFAHHDECPVAGCGCCCNSIDAHDSDG